MHMLEPADYFIKYLCKATVRFKDKLDKWILFCGGGI